MLSPLLALLAACTHPATDGPKATDRGGDDSAPPDDSVPTVPGDSLDSGGQDSSPADSDAPETWPQSCPALYDPDALQQVALDFEPEEWRAIKQDCNSGVQEYRHVNFTWNGETVPAMARLKGNWSWSCDKMQFVISFDEEDSAGRFHGLRKVMLDAPWYDHTMLHERLAFSYFEARGLPYSCVNSARLDVNGEYYGLYVNVERIDQEYLERNFEEPDGNLYQGGSELKTNEEENDTRDLQALNRATTIDEVDRVMDLDEAIAEWASEAMLPAMDNYWAGVEINYYLYDNPSTGFVYLPYDMDLTFGDGAYSDGSLVWPDAAVSDPITYEHYGWLKEDLFKLVLSDEGWCERYVDEVVAARAAFSPEDMATQADAYDAQLIDALDEDPNKPFTLQSHQDSVASLKAFLTTRADYVDAWIAEGGHCPVTAW